MNDLIVQKKLFDIFTRQALFIEQVKANEALLFNDVLAQIESDFKKMLGLIKYENLGELNKAQVQGFIKALRGSQTKIYSKYQRQLLARLQQFTEVVVNQTVIASGSYLNAIQTKQDEGDFIIVPVGLTRAKNLIESEYKDNNFSATNGLFMLLAGTAMLAKFWPTVKNSPMPTSGALLINYVNTAIASNMMKVSQAVMAGWVNKLSVKELEIQVLGSKTTGEGNPNVPGGTKSSEVTKIRNATKAVVASVVQHVGQVAVSSVTSAVWAGYQWLSVMDQRTSGICRYLNNRLFRYGEGPLPPVHPNCRSHTMPATGEASSFTPPNLVRWLIGQNHGFLVGTFRTNVANQFISGDDVTLEENVANLVKPITVEQFWNRTGDLF